MEKPPKGTRGIALLEWARERLAELAIDSEKDADMVGASRALAQSAHAELELEAKREAPTANGTPIHQLPREEQVKAIAAARMQLSALEASLGINTTSSTKTLSAGQPGTVDLISTDDEEDE